MSGCYRDLNAGLVVPIFIHIIRDFPVLLFAFLFMLMAVDYIVIDLEAGQYFVGRFQNLDYMHY